MSEQEKQLSPFNEPAVLIDKDSSVSIAGAEPINPRHQLLEMGSTITRLALPVLIEQFFIVIMGVISTILVANIGPEAISATGNIDTINNIVIAVFSSLAVGGTVIVAQFSGRQDDEMVKKAAAQAMLACFVIAGSANLLIFAFQRNLIQLLFSHAEQAVLTYSYDYLSIVLWSYLPLALMSMAFGVLRGFGNTRTPMVISIMMNIANVILSYGLIYGFQVQLGSIMIETTAYGVRGAAWGLTIARLIGMLLAFIPLVSRSSQMCLNWANLRRLDLPLLRSILNLGIPAGTEQLMFYGGKLIVQTFIVRLGTIALAANAIASSVSMLAVTPGLAMSLAVTTLVGQSIGCGDKRGARNILRFSLWYTALTLLAVNLLMIPFLNQIIRLYTQDAATTKETYTLLIFTLIAHTLVWSPSFALPSGLRGAGDVRYALGVSILSMWLLRIFMGYIFAIVLKMGLIGIWITMYMDWGLRAFLFLRRMRGSRWLEHTVIHK